MAGILLLLAVVAYIDLANAGGDAKVAEFWRRPPPPRELAQRTDDPGLRPPVTRFGVDFQHLPRGEQ